MLTWRNPEQFAVGNLYVDGMSDQTLEFVGVAELPELIDLNLSERVLVFRDVDGAHLVTFGQRSCDQGQTFTTFADRLAEDIEVDGDE